jgi:hypothetical protein
MSDRRASGADVSAASQLLYPELRKLFPDDPGAASCTCIHLVAVIMRDQSPNEKRMILELLAELLGIRTREVERRPRHRVRRW